METLRWFLKDLAKTLPLSGCSRHNASASFHKERAGTLNSDVMMIEIFWVKFCEGSGWYGHQVGNRNLRNRCRCPGRLGRRDDQPSA